jgi:hypothetical protein
VFNRQEPTANWREEVFEEIVIALRGKNGKSKVRICIVSMGGFKAFRVISDIQTPSIFATRGV